MHARRTLPCLLLLAACWPSLDAEDVPATETVTSAAQTPALEFLGTGSDLPFSEAVRVGDMIYLAGQIGVAPGTAQLVSGGIAAETRQTMTNIQGALERYGSSMNRVVRCLVMLADIGEWAAMNEVYVTFFPGPKPARSAMGASGLAMNARVEIECTALAG